MPTAKNYEMLLELAVNLKADKNQAEITAEALERILDSKEFDINVDTDQLKEAFDTLKNLINMSDEELDELRQSLKNLEIDINTEDVEKAVSDLLQSVESLEDIDISKLDKAFENISDEDLEKIQKTLQETFDNYDAKKLQKEVGKLATEFDEADQEARSLLETQKKALAQMKVTGQDGSKQYEKLQEEIKETEKTVKQYADAYDELNKVSSSGETFVDIAAKFEALGNLGQQFEEFSEKGILARDALREIKVQAGLTEEELEQYQAVAERVFDPKVEGLETVQQSIKAVGLAAQSLKDVLQPEEIAKVTSLSAKFAKVFDEDTTDVIRKASPAIREYQLEADSMFGMITVAAQKAAVPQNDLLDSVGEYAAHFNSAGYEAEEMFEILSRGRGQFNTDFIGDAVKEMQIRLNDGTLAKTLGDITGTLPEALAKTFDEIATLGDTGKITAAEVFKLSAKQIKDSFDAGDITKQIAAQLQAALAGTKAEDLTPEKFNEIFVPNIDANRVREEAQKAVTELDNAVGSVTGFQKIQQEFELLATKVSAFTAPVIGGMGNVLTSVSSVAPAISLIAQTDFKKVRKSAEKLSNALSKKLVKALGGTEKAQKLLNIEVLKNPYVLAAAAAVALVVVLKLLADAMNVTTEEQIKENEASQDVIDKQVKMKSSRMRQIKDNHNLVSSYEELGSKVERTADEEERFREVQINLAKTYPGVIDNTKSFAENLDNVRSKANEGSSEINTLKDDISSITDKKITLEVELQKLEAKQAQEDLVNEIADSIDDVDWNDLGSVAGDMLTYGIYSQVERAQGNQTATTKFQDMILGWFGVESTAQKEVKKKLQVYFDAINEATTPEQLAEAQHNMQMALYDPDIFDLPPDVRSKVIDHGENLVKETSEAIVAEQEKQKNRIQNTIKNAFSFDDAGEIDLSKLAKDSEISIKEATTHLLAGADEAIKAGKKEKEVYEDVAKVLKKSPKEVEKLVKEQKESTEEAEKTKKAIDALKEGFSGLLNLAQKHFNAGLEEELLIRAKLADPALQEVGETVESLNRELRVRTKMNFELARQRDRYNKLRDAASKRYENKTAETSYQIAVKTFALEEKILLLQLQEQETLHKGNLIRQGREATEIDELNMMEKRLETQLKINDAFKESYDKLVTQTNEGFKINPDITLKPEEEQALLSQIQKLNSDLQSSESDIIKLRVKIETEAEDIQERLNEIELEGLELEFELGIKESETFEKLKERYTSKLTEMNTEIKANNDTIVNLHKELNDELESANEDEVDGIKTKYQVEINLLNTKNIDLLDQQRSTNDKLDNLNETFYDRQLERIEDYYSDRLAVASETYDKEQAELDKFITKFNTAFNSALDKSQEGDLEYIQEMADSRIEELEREQDLELIGKEEFERRKLEIEEKAESDRMAREEEYHRQRIRMQGLQHGALLEQQRTAALETAKIEKTQAAQSIATLMSKAAAQMGYLSAEDQAELKKLREQFKNADEIIQENATILQSTYKTAGEGLSEAMVDLFAGDSEAAGDAIRGTFSSIFGVMTEALRKFLEGVILEFLFGEMSKLAPGGLSALVLVPLTKTFISGAVHAVADPILNDLMSFSSGGRIDSPTLGLIGDASRLGSQNREWVTTDDQLKQIIGMALSGYNEGLINEIRALRSLLANQVVEYKLKGEDIYVSHKRVEQGIKDRSM